MDRPVMAAMDPFTKVMSDLQSGGPSVELKRQNQHGILETVGDAEMKALGTKARMASTAQLLHNLTPEEKLEWAIETKDEGNMLFQEHKYAEAMEKYVEALTATDFGTSTESEKEKPQEKSGVGNVDNLVVPVLCNLAACCMRLNQWSKAILFCDQVLRMRPRCGKALLRRGKSLLSVGEYQEAKDNFVMLEGTEDHGLANSEMATVRSLIDKANQGIRKDKDAHENIKKSLQRAFQSSSASSSAATITTSSGRVVTVLEGASLEDTVSMASSAAIKRPTSKPEPMTVSEFLVFLLEMAFRFLFGWLLDIPHSRPAATRAKKQS